MIRTQIQLSEQQAKQIKESAARAQVSMAEVIRRAVAQFLAISPQAGEDRFARALAVAGRFASGRNDLSSHHDNHFAEASRQ